MSTQYRLIGPDGPITPAPSQDLNDLVQRALAYGVALGAQGYYATTKMERLSLDWAINQFKVEEIHEDLWNDLDTEAGAFVIWLPALTVEAFEDTDEARDEVTAMEARGVRGMIYTDFEEMKLERKRMLINAH